MDCDECNCVACESGKDREECGNCLTCFNSSHCFNVEEGDCTNYIRISN